MDVVAVGRRHQVRQSCRFTFHPHAKPPRQFHVAELFTPEHFPPQFLKAAQDHVSLVVEVESVLHDGFLFFGRRP